MTTGCNQTGETGMPLRAGRWQEELFKSAEIPGTESLSLMDEKLVYDIEIPILRQDEALSAQMQRRTYS